MSSCCSLFLLVEGGRVHIRDWRDRKSSRADTKRKPVAPGALKTRPCWFYDHHPQRCPLQAEHCAFAHGPDDLRPSTKPRKKIKNDALWLIHLSTAFLINSRESPDVQACSHHGEEVQVQVPSSASFIDAMLHHFWELRYCNFAISCDVSWWSFRFARWHLWIILSVEI